MTRTVTYRCSECLEGAVTRSFDTAHLMARCPACGSFTRLINGAVIEQYEAYEAEPPEAFEWNRLDRLEKLLVAERITRTDRTLADFSIEERGSSE
ncbi:hypothetical protein [Halorubrum vacuolatum]|uniref:Uncharacterized protein n=1 Tax=Halorubrum vacuolatum TaxID=63740 RepID=A0A238V808_HALVU|nr:hypothetical protein [Halorubrum vacuolatum]SNR30234.1 hypothetical protein SAMN06264855_10239 [Halorubrum vacuolatum]